MIPTTTITTTVENELKHLYEKWSRDLDNEIEISTTELMKLNSIYDKIYDAVKIADDIRVSRSEIGRFMFGMLRGVESFLGELISKVEK